MSNPTSNFGWQMPTATDLVTDLPADFEVFGQAVDSSMADLKGGTTGQVLAKASNADMDFVWSADAAGMTNPMTTTGDTIYSSSGSTPARLGIGTTGQVLTVSSGLPAWSSPGGMTQIASGSFSGSSIVISSIPTTYKDLVLVSRSLGNSVTNEGARIRFNNDSTANRHYDISAYATTSNAIFNATYAGFTTDKNNTSDLSLDYVYFPDYANTATWKMFWSNSLATASTATNFNFRQFLGFYNQTTAITSLGFIPQNGTFTSGSYILYGVA